MMRLSTVALWTRGRLAGVDAEVSGVTIDTRSIQPGNLFVALPGERVDGHDFVAAALASGAAGALVSRPVAVDIPQVVVADATLALGDLASSVRAQSNVKVVGITGSNGKTTVKSLVASILRLQGPTHVNSGNYNNELGLPLTLLAMPADSEYAVLEMGAGKPGDIDYLAAIARPQVALVNNVAPAHLARMGSLEGVAETKGAIYQHLPADGVAVINADDSFARFFQGLAGSRQQLSFGLQQPADVWAEAIELDATGSRFALHYRDQSVAVELPLAGRHNISNALAAAAVALGLGVALASIAEGLALAPAVAGRLRRLMLADGAIVIDDSYNANPGSVRAAIDTLAAQPGERWLVLGDMAELGPAARTMHAEVGAYARKAGIDALFCVGSLAAEAAAAFGPAATAFADQQALLATLQAGLHQGVVCLVKGSRSAGMDRVVQAISGNREVSHAV
ncbi:UDP-N-acetylmuramoyl-tripeptide--D-alanyl-D-alanine ligase [Frateuria aurantia]